MRYSALFYAMVMFVICALTLIDSEQNTTKEKTETNKCFERKDFLIINSLSLRMVLPINQKYKSSTVRYRAANSLTQ